MMRTNVKENAAQLGSCALFASAALVWPGLLGCGEESRDHLIDAADHAAEAAKSVGRAAREGVENVEDEVDRRRREREAERDAPPPPPPEP